MSTKPPTGAEAPDSSIAVDSAHDPMAKVRPGEPAGERLARARLLGTLFGHDAATTFGRFHVLDRLGAGGMGVVYKAYDPDLDRGVALKLVDVAAQDRSAALAEAKALARLSHPNVVPIYDVGLDGNHVYLVMELVRGRPLDRWSEGSGWRTIVEVYRQAGAALAAAHAAGLVHRDFKPANAIVGDDGRVRVIDFGLACEADDPAHTGGRRAAGTRGFMAPEIAARAAITPAADQYSFCVALAQTLKLTKEPPPRWLVAALDRGRAAEPARRYASMNELLRELARDPARTRRRAAAIGGIAAAIGVAAFLIGQGRTTSDALAVCDDGPAELETAWPAAARRAALDRVARLTGDGPAIRARLQRDVDQYVGRWAAENRSACRDRILGSREEITNHRLACLRRGSLAFDDIGQLVASVAPEGLAAVQTAVLSMTDPARCAEEALRSSSIEPPPPGMTPAIERIRDQLERVRTWMDLGRYDDADREAAAIVTDARRLHYDPVLAESLLVSGHARMQVARAQAVEVLREATTVAIRARMDAVASEAWARRVFAQGTTSPGPTLPDLEVMPALADRTPSAELARALLYNNLGSVALANDDLAGARERFQQAARVASSVTGRRDRRRLELLAIRANLAFVIDRAAGDKLLIETAQEWTDLLGENHPSTLEVRWMRGSVTIDPLAEALELLVPVCEASRPHVRVGRCWTEVGLLHLDLGHAEDARNAFVRAFRSSPKPPPLIVGGHALFAEGAPETAANELAGAIAKIPPRPGERSWERAPRAELTLALGRALRAQGKLREARSALETAVSELAAITRFSPGARYERQLGRARVQLALVLSSLGAPRDERAPIAAAAVAWLRRVGGPPEQISELSALITRGP